MKRLAKMLILPVLLMVCGIVLTACGGNQHVHDWETVITTSATCTESGLKVKTCKKDSSHVEGMEIIPSLGHNYGSWQVNPQATCTTEGKRQRVCSRCEDIDTGDAAIDPDNHDWGDIIIDIPATCTSMGWGTRVCKANESHVELTPLGIITDSHDFGAWSVTTPATCVADGLQKRTCKHNTEHVESKPIEKLSHTASANWTTTLAATCTSDGTRELRCVLFSVCGTVFETETVDMYGHTEGNWHTKLAPTCLADGVAELRCTRFGSGGCTEVFDTDTISRLGHTQASSWTTTLVATCEIPGEKELRCVRHAECNMIFSTEMIDVLGHTASSTWTTTISETCTTDGERVKRCIRWDGQKCNTIFEIENIDALTHVSTETWVTTQQPTCTMQGGKEIQCVRHSQCGMVFDTAAIDPLGHTASATWTTSIEPTCTAGGVKQLRCVRYAECSFAFEEDIVDALGHAAGNWVTTKSPICNLPGEKELRCVRHGSGGCQEILDVEEIVSLVHNFGDWLLINIPTCTHDGLEIRVCKHNTQHVEQRAVPALGHAEASFWVVTQQPTCADVGVQELRCSRYSVCREVFDRAAVNFLGHVQSSNWVIKKQPTCTETGIRQQQCIRHSACGAVFTTEIMHALDHEAAAKWVTTQAATCTRTGIEELYCVRHADCRKVMGVRDVSALGHQQSTIWTTTKQPTCLGAGEQELRCVRHSFCGWVYDVSSITPLGHTQSSTWTTTKAATCTTTGTAELRCVRYSFCMQVFETSVINALGHTGASSWVTITPATCTTYGVQNLRCVRYSACSHIVDTRAVEPFGHTASSTFVVTKSATCTATGTKEYRCVLHAACGYVFDTAAIAELGHDWSNWITTQVARCVTNGTQKRYCSNSEDCTETRALAMLGHTEASVWTTTKSATCSSTGTEQLFCVRRGDGSCNHVYEINTLPALGHTASSGWTTTKLSTCTEEGTREIRCVRYGRDLCTEVFTDEVLPANGHQEANVLIREAEPTCTETGIDKLFCVRCAVTLREDIVPALGHTELSVWRVTTPATCTSEGISQLQCVRYSDCRKVMDTSILQPLGHVRSSSWTTATQPTCTSTGVSNLNCVRFYDCRTVLETNTLPELGHSSSSTWVTTLPATCEYSGTREQRCIRHSSCGTVMNAETIDSLGHIESSVWTMLRQPTCTAEGEQEKRCLRHDACGYVFENTAISSRGHAATVERLRQTATCTDTGTIDFVCPRCNNTLETKPIPALGHNKTDWTISQSPTCLAQGLERRVCLHNGVISCEETRPISALGHTESGFFVTTLAPTCTSTGTKEMRCTRFGYNKCFEVIENQTIDALEHIPSVVWERTQAPTCTTPGTEKLCCILCTEQLETRQVSATGHMLTSWITTKAATCTQSGTRDLRCLTCATVISQDVIAVLGHSVVNYWVTVIPATCESSGLREKRCSRYAACEHYTERETIVALGHQDPGGWTVETQATCTTNGSQVKRCLRASCELDRQIINALGHNEAVKITVRVTCTTDGLKETYCMRCYTILEAEVINKFEHDWGNWTITKQPTCSEFGSRRRVCSYDYNHTDTESINPLGHEQAGSWITTREATCNALGSAELRCIRYDVCREIFDTQQIPMLPHQASETWVITQAPTCGATGLEVQRCVNCNTVVNTRQVSILAHNYSDWTVTTTPTCLTGGERRRECSNINCPERIDIETLSALGHDWGEWVVTAKPGCTSTGAERRICLRDSAHQETNVLPATGHDYNWETTIEPTVKTDGEAKNICSNCSQVSGTKILHATGTVGLEFILIGQEYTVFNGDAQGGEIVIPAYYNEKPVTAIGYRGFAGHSLDRITILGSNLQTIETGAFANCVNLTTFEIPANVFLGDNPFIGCNLEITVAQGYSQYKVDGNCLIRTADNKLISVFNNSVMPAYITQIGAMAFYGLNIQTFEIPTNITHIGSAAFGGWAAQQTIFVKGFVSEAEADDYWGGDWRYGCGARVEYNVQLHVIELIGYINNIPDLERYYRDNWVGNLEETISFLRGLYNNLSHYEKLLITNLNKLEAAEECYAFIIANGGGSFSRKYQIRYSMDVGSKENVTYPLIHSNLEMLDVANIPYELAPAMLGDGTEFVFSHWRFRDKDKSRTVTHISLDMFNNYYAEVVAVFDRLVFNITYDSYGFDNITWTEYSIYHENYIYTWRVGDAPYVLKPANIILAPEMGIEYRFLGWYDSNSNVFVTVIENLTQNVKLQARFSTIRTQSYIKFKLWGSDSEILSCYAPVVHGYYDIKKLYNSYFPSYDNQILIFYTEMYGTISVQDKVYLYDTPVHTFYVKNVSSVMIIYGTKALMDFDVWFENSKISVSTNSGSVRVPVGSKVTINLQNWTGIEKVIVQGNEFFYQEIVFFADVDLIIEVSETTPPVLLLQFETIEVDSPNNSSNGYGSLIIPKSGWSGVINDDAELVSQMYSFYWGIESHFRGMGGQGTQMIHSIMFFVNGHMLSFEELLHYNFNVNEGIIYIKVEVRLNKMELNIAMLKLGDKNSVSSYNFETFTIWKDDNIAIIMNNYVSRWADCDVRFTYNGESDLTLQQIEERFMFERGTISYLNITYTPLPEYLLTIIFRDSGNDYRIFATARKGKTVGEYGFDNRLQLVQKYLKFYTDEKRTEIFEADFMNVPMYSNLTLYVAHAPGFTISFQTDIPWKSGYEIEPRTVMPGDKWEYNSLIPSVQAGAYSEYVFAHWEMFVDGQYEKVTQDFYWILPFWGSDITLLARCNPIGAPNAENLIGSWYTIDSQQAFSFFDDGTGVKSGRGAKSTFAYRKIQEGRYALYFGSYTEYIVLDGEAFYHEHMTPLFYRATYTVNLTLNYYDGQGKRVESFKVPGSAMLNQIEWLFASSKEYYLGDRIVGAFVLLRDIADDEGNLTLSVYENGTPVFLYLNYDGGKIDGFIPYIPIQRESLRAYDSSLVLAQINPVKEGFVFVGWFDINGEEVEILSKLEMFRNPEIFSHTLTARYIHIPEAVDYTGKDFIGKWEAVKFSNTNDKIAKLALTFNTDGTYQFVMILNGKLDVDISGYYRYENEQINILSGLKSLRTQGAVNASFASANILVVTIGYDTFSMNTDKPGVDYSGEWFVGTYSFFDENGMSNGTENYVEKRTVNISLGADGILTMGETIIKILNDVEIGREVSSIDESIYRYVDGRIIILNEGGPMDITDLLTFAPVEGFDYSSLAVLGTWYTQDGVIPDADKIIIGDDGKITIPSVQLIEGEMVDVWTRISYAQLAPDIYGSLMILSDSDPVVLVFSMSNDSLYLQVQQFESVYKRTPPEPFVPETLEDYRKGLAEMNAFTNAVISVAMTMGDNGETTVWEVEGRKSSELKHVVYDGSMQRVWEKYIEINLNESFTYYERLGGIGNWSRQDVYPEHSDYAKGKDGMFKFDDMAPVFDLNKYNSATTETEGVQKLVYTQFGSGIELVFGGEFVVLLTNYRAEITSEGLKITGELYQEGTKISDIVLTVEFGTAKVSIPKV